VQHVAGALPFSRHFAGKRFFNPNASPAPGFLDVLRWKLSSRPEPSARFVSDVEQSKPPSRVEGTQLHVTLINHSTLLLQQNDFHILTDPIVYFAGDTGFGDHFAQIRERFGAPRLALLPIGAYEPRWFMAPVHMAPDEAVRAHEILAAKTSIAIHHGTFQLADEGIDKPKKRLKACAPGDSFLVLDNGESVTLE
jgi:L-ascorbate metabolism protein UlaG (beta-lactamase superfamily)